MKGILTRERLTWDFSQRLTPSWPGVSSEKPSEAEPACYWDLQKMRAKKSVEQEIQSGRILIPTMMLMMMVMTMAMIMMIMMVMMMRIMMLMMMAFSGEIHSIHWLAEVNGQEKNGEEVQKRKEKDEDRRDAKKKEKCSSRRSRKEKESCDWLNSSNCFLHCGVYVREPLTLPPKTY